jgi:hypothetical protein
VFADVGEVAFAVDVDQFDLDGTAVGTHAVCGAHEQTSFSMA